MSIEGDELAARQDDIDARIGVLLTQTERLGQRNRHGIRILAVSVMFDIVLSIGLGGFAYEVHRLTVEQGRTTMAQAQAACDSGNEGRTLNAQLWNYILSQPLGPQTPDQQATISRFKAFIAQIFTPRDCSKGGE